MRSLFGTIARMAPLVWAALASAAAHGAAVQILDSVDVFGRDSTTASSTVLEMAFRDPLPRPAPFDQLNVAGTTILACQRAADQGLYCLDGNFVRYFPDTKAVPYGNPLPDIELLDCRDPALKLDARRPNPCTSMTVDLDGNLWLAGRKANSHSVLKVVRESTLNAKWNVTCTAASGTGPWFRLATPAQDAPNIPVGQPQTVPTFCAREFAPGRPVLVDTNMIDGELSNGFMGVPSVLGLEERKTVMLFPDASSALGNPNSGIPAKPIEFASGKAGWNLIGNEQILSAALLQYGETGPKQNFVIVTTTFGRVMAKKADRTTGVGIDLAFPVFTSDPAECVGTGEQTYDVRVSSESGRVYVADKFCKRVLALKWITASTPDAPPFPAYCAPVDPARPNDFCLVNASETTTSGTTQDVTLATGATSPDGLSVAPGIGIDLRDCGFNSDGTPRTCPWVPDGADRNFPDNPFNAAEASGVRIEPNGKSKMTVFQVLGIPDCRYWTDGPGCVTGIVDGGYLNITPLLPDDVTSQFQAGLPALLISPKYRGQVNSLGKRTIDLFFAIPEPGIQFRDTFRLSFDVGDLTDGVKNGCGGNTPGRPDYNWNVVVTGSEKYQVVDGPNLGYVETLVNDGCSNPDGVTSKRFSYYAYNLEVVPNGDGVYALMVRSQFDDILATQRKTACEPYDPPTDGSVLAPLDKNTTCPDLEAKWYGADDKLVKCISGTTYPRQSEAVNNCNAFLSQLGQYESALNSSPRRGQDPANRIGELKARVKVLRYVFERHFVPSIPPNGFCSLTATGSCTP